MVEYSFISVPVTRQRAGLDVSGDYQAIIRREAAEGWAFVQAIDLTEHVNPRIELVFTRKGEKR